MPFLSSPGTAVRAHPWRSAVIVLVLFLVGGGIWRFTRPKQPEYVTATAKKGDLRQTVEAVGTVVSEQNLNLQFKASGIVAKVFVREGDAVKARQRLAALRAGSLAASVSAAAARVQESEAQLAAMRAGTRPEDIVIAEASLSNKRASLGAARISLKAAEETLVKSEGKLRALRQQLDTDLAGAIASAASIVSQKRTTAEQGLAALTDIFANTDVNAATIREHPDDYVIVRQQMAGARDALANARASKGDYESALRSLQDMRAAVASAADALSRAYDYLSSLVPGVFVTIGAQTSYKSTVATHRTNVQTALRDLDAAIMDLHNLSASLQTQIAGEEASLQSAKGSRERAEADIRTFETAVLIEEAQLQLKRAGSRPEDIRAAEARLRQARADLTRASSDYGDTVIASAVAGKVTRVFVKEGEQSPLGPAITVVGDIPFRVEMFVSEIDVPKMQRSQSGSIELVAFANTPYPVSVAEIDPAATDVQGVSKYRVKLDFLAPHPEMKIGMKGDVTVVTDERRGVVYVPRRAILEKDGRAVIRVIDGNGEVREQEVSTGMEGGAGDVEITRGLEGGETVVVLVKQ